MYIRFTPLTYNVLSPLEAISLAYRDATGAIAKSLRLFAEDQQ